jgi:hypothetical protein
MNTKAVQFKSCWSMFWDMETDDPRHGSGVMEVWYDTPYALRQEVGKPMRIDTAIKRALEKDGQNHQDEGGNGNTPNDYAEIQPELQDVTHRNKTILRMEYHGRVPRKRAEEFERYIMQEATDEGAKFQAPDFWLSGSDSLVPEDAGDVADRRLEIGSVFAHEHGAEAADPNQFEPLAFPKSHCNLAMEVVIGGKRILTHATMIDSIA